MICPEQHLYKGALALIMEGDQAEAYNQKLFGSVWHDAEIQYDTAITTELSLNPGRFLPRFEVTGLLPFHPSRISSNTTSYARGR
jgi:hypothetical protein